MLAVGRPITWADWHCHVEMPEEQRPPLNRHTRVMSALAKLGKWRGMCPAGHPGRRDQRGGRRLLLAGTGHSQSPLQICTPLPPSPRSRKLQPRSNGKTQITMSHMLLRRILRNAKRVSREFRKRQTRGVKREPKTKRERERERPTRRTF